MQRFDFRDVRNAQILQCLNKESKHTIYMKDGVTLSVFGDNPVFFAVKYEEKFFIPEIVWYSKDASKRIENVGIYECDQKIYLTCCDKDKVLSCQIPRQFIDDILLYASCVDRFRLNNENLILDKKITFDTSQFIERKNKVLIPDLPRFTIKNDDSMNFNTINLNNGITFEMEICTQELRNDSILFYTKKNGDKGISVKTTGNGAIEILLNDGMTENAFITQNGILRNHKKQYISVIIDGACKIIFIVVDRVLYKKYARFSSYLSDCNGEPNAIVGCECVDVTALKIYSNAILFNQTTGCRLKEEYGE